MFEKIDRKQVSITKNSIKLQSLVIPVAVAFLIPFSILSGCDSSNRSDYYAQSSQDLLDTARKERSEARELLERVENETQQKMEDANRRCNNGDQKACDEAYQMFERRILGEERATDYMERRSREWRR